MKPGWTEIVRQDEETTDPAKVEGWLRLRLAAGGVNRDNLDLRTDVEIRQWLVRGTGGELLPHIYSYLVRDEALRGSDPNE